MNPDQQKNYWDKDSSAVAEASLADQETASKVQNTAPDEASPSQRIKNLATDPIRWTASEYIHLDKNGLWYVIFALVVLGLIASDVFVLKSWTFSLLVIVMAFAVIVYIRRPPREIQYTLSGKQGLYIGERLYNFSDYKAFGLIRDGEHHSIMLIPVKRFATGVSVYFPEEAGEKIVDILGSILPMENLKLDAIDLIVRRLRL